MAIYKVSDLLNQLSEIITDGYEYVEITELEAEDDMPASLSFSAVESDDAFIDYDDIDSIDVPADYDYDSVIHASPDEPCYFLTFTFGEICGIDWALDNALKYVKDCLEDPSYDRDARDKMKKSSVGLRNLQAKLSKFFKKVIIR